MSCSRGVDYFCQDCNSFKNTNDLEGIQLPLEENDFYLKKIPNNKEAEVNLLLNKSVIDSFIPRLSNKHGEALEKANCQKIEDKISLRNRRHSLLAFHFSPFIHSEIIEEIKGYFLFCPEGRLQGYKDKDFQGYIREKRLSGAKMRRLIDLIIKIVDPKIQDYRYEDLIRKINDHELTVSIAEQGSGIRSLICLAADILASDNSKVIMIDEPELGLNPLAKQEFIEFVLQMSNNKQIFLATQDPAFVNPILWNDNSDRISVYLFSLQDEDFVKVDMQQNKEDPEVFAGYLPHTTSLKRIHIYVEGTSDVYTFQVLLKKFLKEAFNKRRFEIENKIGIFHLCGDLWPHLLYTVPKKPYQCIIILDGDKKEMVPKIVGRYNESDTNVSKFSYANSIDEVKRAFQSKKNHPIYCLDKKKIEAYLPMNLISISNSKKVDNPRAAERLEKLPEELLGLFREITAREFRLAE